MKRMCDFLLALVLLVLLSPLLLAIYVLISVTSEGPALFKQVRMGKNNIEFYIYKFRTMKINTPNIATIDFHDVDKYVTSIGRFLRKTSLDELPQLFNIIDGTMSFVGPRPVIIEEREVIKMRTLCGVHKVTPGLTGWAQVNGRDSLDNETKVMLDLEYAKRNSLVMDFKILIMTFFKVFNQADIREPNNSELAGDENLIQEETEILIEEEPVFKATN